MKISKIKIQNRRLLFCILHFAFCVSAVFAQSTNQNFPTPVTANDLSGTIRARDIGDARLTTYFYVFNGAQGDVFINVVTRNLDGDIDVFTAEGLRPLTKIRVYSDNPESETGRVIYLRQPQKLILRVEGRTPNDEPATFRIKFAGSFQAAAATAETDDSKQPEVTSKTESDVRVNSVGTIVEVKPKPTPTPRQSTARTEREEPKSTTEPQEPEKTETAKSEEPEVNREERMPEAAVTENRSEKKEEAENKTDESVAEKETPKPNRPTRRRTNPRSNRSTNRAETETKPAPEKKPAAVDLSQLESIRLVVDFKDGRKIERPMNEVLRFGVDKGILTIIAKDGSIVRHSILDIARITVE